MSFSLIILSLGVCLIVTTAVLKVINGSRYGSNFSLPPGPKGLPLFGNLNDLPGPGALEAHHWLKHKEIYGPISSVTVMGQTIIIINDIRIALELLEKRSIKHSSRPRQIFLGEMVGWERALVVLPYNERLRTYRKNIARVIGSKPAAAQYDALQEAEVGHFLLHVLNDPNSLRDHIRKETGAIILKMSYGYNVEQFKNDYLVDIAGDAVDIFTRAVPGSHMVDTIPFLRYLPDWIPGTEFKKNARQWAAGLNDVTEKPYAFVKHQMERGKDNNSFLSRLLKAGDSTPEEKLTNKWSAMSLYTGGADTTVSSLSCFFLAMTLFPEVQEKAQEEIDRVIGRDRLPSFSDRSNLPYIEATIKEVLRWHPVIPMGVPHMSTADDIFEEYFIPKGSLLSANIWHFTHDPEVYKEPMTFDPDRFLPSKGSQMPPDPSTFVFGFGRRLCPGRILADNSLYLTVAQSLAVFSIKGVGGIEEDVASRMSFTTGVISHPKPFQAEIKPRSTHHEKLIRSIEQTFPWQESDASILANITS